MTLTTPPRIDETTLPEGVSTTFTHPCPFGCVIRVVDGQEESHVCVGVQIIAAVAPRLTIVEAFAIAGSLKPLLRELNAGSWEDGIRSGREGLCNGVDNDVPEGALPPAAPIVIEAQWRAWTEAAGYLADLAGERQTDEALNQLRDEFRYRAEEPRNGVCVGCGCTEERACADGCSWVRPGLCSACVVVPERQAAAS